MSAIMATIILEVLTQKIKDGEVFTAWDVTTAARALSNDYVYHTDVQAIVVNEFETDQMQDYCREVKTLNDGRSSQPYVYYPDSKSASDHPLVDGVTASNVVVSSPAIDVSVKNPDGSYGTVSDSDSNITSEGRINIPKSLLDAVVPTGGSYDISFNGTLHCKCPNKDGRVRVSINSIGFVGSKAKFSIDKNTIIIESV
jgi:hypothetical protein